MKSLNETLKDLNICIVKHTFTVKGGVEEELLSFLKDKVKNLIYISHPFKEARLPSLSSEISIYKSGVLTKQIKAPLFRGPSILFYIKDVIFTLWYVLRTNLIFDLFIGVDNLNAFAGYILKKIGRVKKVVFYVIDYSPKRFKNNLLNSTYHFIDRLACYKSDCIWNISSAMMEARRKQGINIEKCKCSITVPHGNRFKHIKRYKIEQIERHRIAYFGLLAKQEGVDKIIDLLYFAKKEVPDASLLVVGSGGMEAYMKKRAKELNIDGSVQFKGFIEDNREYEELLARSAIGLAPFKEDRNSYKYYCDPGKVKAYLACGLPVIITKVPRVSEEIQRKKAGFAVSDNVEEMKEALLKLLKDDSLYESFRKNAIEMGSQYDWDLVFNNALLKTL